MNDTQKLAAKTIEFFNESNVVWVQLSNSLLPCPRSKRYECLVTAIARTRLTQGFDCEIEKQLRKQLLIILNQSPDNASYLADWNDEPERTKQDVLELLAKAIIFDAVVGG